MYPWIYQTRVYGWTTGSCSGSSTARGRRTHPISAEMRTNFGRILPLGLIRCRSRVESSRVESGVRPGMRCRCRYRDMTLFTMVDTPLILLLGGIGIDGLVFVLGE
ncbi:hypothetical protein P168DRAFT_12719 [Aspergillus campestris IBT 28561]|uniref:Uncharacterized protein n=1 Tax=Aspergillus campestris (strain IBT 28561) TaxID=1392248 RepID=A0A2I1DEF1_ASPC2|nr:uncharacterized protein P168DRAFT_12719 [Aspergillus campestris IBT 28561]PKY08263.1 hypothetical protein P168DRAFT_12719 [Aspergillus campestris IBT 28561]